MPRRILLKTFTVLVFILYKEGVSVKVNPFGTRPSTTKTTPMPTGNETKNARVDKDLSPSKKLDQHELDQIIAALGRGLKMGKMSNEGGAGKGGKKANEVNFMVEKVQSKSGDKFIIRRTTGQRGRKHVAEVIGFERLTKLMQDVADSKLKKELTQNYEQVVARKLIESAKTNKMIHLTREDLNSSVLKPLNQYYKKYHGIDVSI